MDGIQTEGFVQQSRELDHLMMSNPDMENMVRRLIRKVIAKARKDMSEGSEGKHEGITTPDIQGGEVGHLPPNTWW